MSVAFIFGLATTLLFPDAPNNSSGQRDRRRGSPARADTQVIAFKSQSEFSAVAEANVGAASKGKGKLAPSASDTSGRFRKVRSAKQRLGEWHHPVQLAARKSRAEDICFRRQILRNMA